MNPYSLVIAMLFGLVFSELLHPAFWAMNKAARRIVKKNEYLKKELNQRDGLIETLMSNNIILSEKYIRAFKEIEQLKEAAKDNERIIEIHKNPVYERNSQY